MPRGQWLHPHQLQRWWRGRGRGHEPTWPVDGSWAHFLLTRRDNGKDENKLSSVHERAREIPCVSPPQASSFPQTRLCWGDVVLSWPSGTPVLPEVFVWPPLHHPTNAGHNNTQNRRKQIWNAWTLTKMSKKTWRNHGLSSFADS